MGKEVAMEAPCRKPPRKPFRWKPLAFLLSAFVAVDKCAHLVDFDLVSDTVTDVAVADAAVEAGVQVAGAAGFVVEQTSRSLAEKKTDSDKDHAAEDDHGDGNATHGDGNATHTGDEHEEHAHPHYALVAIVLTLIVGTGILHLTFFKPFHGLQTTVALFVAGIMFAVIMDGLKLKNSMNIVGVSYDMWTNIDPHLMLFTLLPPLLAGDAMTINTQVVSKVALQCLYLAGPGVAMGSGLTATFLYFYLPYDWDFMLCLSMGAVLSATDPVAVVALLKDLGASPTLTVQIQGESLLNDGTAIVLYTVAYRIVSGEKLSSGEIVMFLVKAVLYAWMLGMVVGWVFQFWIRKVRDDFDHNSALVQVALTIACAYSSFTIAEGQFHISGVLATVAASIVLAHTMWLDIVDKETMLTIWHMFEYLGNTIIFCLAGTLTGRTMVKMNGVDYLHLLVIYVVLVVIRGFVIVGSRPLLTLLHADRQPVTFADTLVMTWGGLRGAVGLALAMMINIDRAGGTLSQQDGDRALFYVGGIAFMTLMINATTCPILVKYLGITRQTEAKNKLMKLVVRQVSRLADALDGADKASKTIHDMVHDLEHHIPSNVVQDKALFSFRPTKDVILDLESARSDFNQFMTEPANQRLRKEFIKLMPYSPDKEATTARRIEVCKDRNPNPDVARATKEIFLALMAKSYEQMIENQDIEKSLGEIMLSSTTFAIQHINREGWGDLAFLTGALGLTKHERNIHDAEEFRHVWNDMDLAEEFEEKQQKEHNHSGLHRFVESAFFSGIVSVAILLNAVVVLVEDAVHVSKDLFLYFFVAEFLFTLVFLAEFILRLIDQKLRYWKQAWNIFDFVLVGLSIVSLVYGILVISEDAEVNETANNSQAARAMKVLKTLRAVRLVRLFHLLQEWVSRHGVKRNDDVRIRKKIKKFEIFASYIRAHTKAQKRLVKFFGEVEPEIALCLLESETAVWRSMHICAREKKNLPNWILEEQLNCRRAVQTLKHYEHWAHDAASIGLFSMREAHEIVHTLQHHLKKYQARINNLRHGREERPMWRPDGTLVQFTDAEDTLPQASSME